MKQTILLVCNTAWGIANFRANLVQHWVSEGKRVIAIAPADAKSQEKLVSMGAEFVELALDNRGSNPWQELRIIWQLRQLYRYYQPQLVIHYTIKPVIYGSWAATLAGVPSLAVVTGQGFAFLNKGLKAFIARNLYRFSLRFARGIWFLNQDDFDLFTRSGLAPRDKSQLLPGEGVNINHFSPIPNPHQDGVIRLLLIARLLYDKGIAEYAEAAGKLKQFYNETINHHAINPRDQSMNDRNVSLPRIQFQLLGPFYPQNPQAITPEVIAHWQSEDWIHYLGETDDVRDYIAQCDALVLPSYAEGLPRTVLEAMSMGKPVIATNVTGCRDLVMNGKTGLLCEVKNAHALADAVMKFVELTPQERQAMGNAGRIRVCDLFSDDQVIKQYDEFLNRL